MQFAITLLQALQDYHTINAILINLPSFEFTAQCTIYSLAKTKVLYLKLNSAIKTNSIQCKTEKYRNNTEIIMSHFAVLKHYGIISI
jgi:hypothetical protein